MAAVSLVALALRWYGTDWGAPYGYHFDEPFVLKPALRMAERGDPNPHFFRYPSALIYAETAIALAYHRLGGMDLTVPSGPAYGPSDLGPWSWPALLAGRRLVAVAGTLSVAAAGLLAWRIAGAPAALAAAALLAVLPLHVEHSHYLTTDVPAAGWLLLAFALAAAPPSKAAVLGAGAALGAATATKYTAAVALPALMLLSVGAPGTRWRNPFLLAAAAACAFVLLCPFAVLDWRVFLADLSVVREHYTTGHLGSEGNANWSWYIERLADGGLGTTGMLALFAGNAVACGAALRDWIHQRNRSSFVLLTIAITALCWFAWLGTVRVRFERNLIPPLTLAAVAAGCGAGLLVEAARRRGRLVAGCAAAALILVLAAPARVAVHTAARFGNRDTRERAQRWIEANLPAGARIVREEYGPRPDPTRYRVEYLWSAAFREPRWYQRNGVDAVVVSSLVYRRFLRDPEKRYPQIVERYRRIFKWPRLVRIAPGPQELGPVVSVFRPPPLPDQP
ncbi:MAG: hypothetical protein D6760_01925 [Deltaproteobacteria bacterium]|nr:MAG: hypothetical protein D6760_01925 [Deltaproteobacteria bacterium]